MANMDWTLTVGKALCYVIYMDQLIQYVRGILCFTVLTIQSH